MYPSWSQATGLFCITEEGNLMNLLLFNKTSQDESYSYIFICDLLFVHTHSLKAKLNAVVGLIFIIMY